MRTEPGFWRACWSGPTSRVVTIMLLLTMLPALYGFLQWGVVHAVWQADAQACADARGVGACWGVIVEKHRLILFGRYPFDAHWRPMLASIALVLALIYSANPARWGRNLGLCWLVIGGGCWALMAGRLGPCSLKPLGLTPVSSDMWGGLPLTLMLSVLGVGLAFPLAVLLALGRRSHWPVLSSACAGFIELVRGVPLVSVLFMASFMIPLLLPAGTSPDVLLRVTVALALFLAAYLAEVVRGGLQGVSQGQTLAATALGLNYIQMHRHVLLPQALLNSLPAMVNHFIGLFKDTSLVTIVSLYELSGAMALALNGDADWRPFKIEAYLFIALIYFVFCYSLSRYSLGLQQRHALRRA
ncbi:MAG: amino acid ABC transporter permease [Alphaproteobacteria bacterium]|nr:amino acid ABC transporter permease [Alphaproteobacteria bacterium]